MKLSHHDIVLIRCGLLRRMDTIKHLPESYEASRILLGKLYWFVTGPKDATFTLEIDNEVNIHAE